MKFVGEKGARAISVGCDGESYCLVEDWIRNTEMVFFVKITDPDYPQLMINVGVAPLVLYARGNRGLMKSGGRHITVVGSAHPDKEGEYNAKSLGAAFAL